MKKCFKKNSTGITFVRCLNCKLQGISTTVIYTCYDTNLAALPVPEESSSRCRVLPSSCPGPGAEAAGGLRLLLDAGKPDEEMAQLIMNNK